MRRTLAIIFTWVTVVGVTPMAFSQDPISKGTWVYRNDKPVSVTIDYGTKLTAEDIERLSTVDSLSRISMGYAGVDSEYVSVEGDLFKLGGLKNLEIVYLNIDGIVDDDVKFTALLPKLRELEFNAKNGEGGCTDRCADSLSSARTLQELRIYNGQFTDKFVDEITQSLPGLEVLMLNSPELTDESLRLIAERCPKLKSLSISSRHFTAEGLKHLDKLRNLEERSVSLSLSGSGPQDQTNEQGKEKVVVGFRRLYGLHILVMKTNNAIVQTIQDEATAKQAAKNVEKLFPLKVEIRYLERALRDFGVGPDQQLYDEYKQQRAKLSAAYVKLALKVKDQPYFDTFNTAYIETSRETRTLKQYSIPEGHAQRGDGPQLVIWLPPGATPEIDLSREKGILEVFVVDEKTGELHRQRQTITCGGKALLPVPDRKDGNLYWLRPLRESNASDSDTQQVDQ